MKPLRTGLALSATVALFYSLCTLVEVALPNQFMNFMNALFHGLDFSKLVSSEPYHWASFIYALIVMAVWAFAAGAFFAFIHNTLAGVGHRHVMQHE
ncbi:DUF5676 family membrane protein [Noviherbaspirillum pedocola]|uniref:Uncharacterized protein n=1 Tax=Noviherbaspirillum pedocola TaxID=2801341 RepID=A0A934SXF7_9BURK|nr:DUF5676 family membrane protein [Noviherbaspirillum pedocola]MBK4734642.1 hypothetical protein [Noviherbaspirillum pedocola]